MIKKNLKVKLFAVLFFTSLPVILFFLFEISFRLLSLGMATDPLIAHPLVPNLMVENPDFYKKYYPSATTAPGESARSILLNKIKPQGVKRGFVLGESTPQGFPYNSNQGFIKMAENGLAVAGQKPVVEIINLAKTAMSSYYVRDAAPKLLAYDPDFLIIYVGHNEFYGNMGEASGGSHWGRLLNLTLKESRVFQVIFNLLNSSASELSDGTLMAQQFSKNTFPINQDTDNRILSNYLDNLDAAIAPFRSRNIPVFIMTPVSNMLSMPPFAGANQDDFQLLIEKGRDAYQKGNWDSAEALLPEIEKALESSPQQAQLLWLSGVINSYKKESLDSSLFKRAKDADIIPFRARSNLVDGLADHFSKSPNNQGVTLINTADSLEKYLGPQWTSDIVFLDHVHFNKQGQSLVSGILAKSLNEVLQLGVSGAGLAAFYAVPEKVWSSVNLTYFSEALAYLSLERLFDDSPFKDMPISYSRLTMEFFKSNDLWRSLGISKAVLSGDEIQLKKAYLELLNLNNQTEGILAEAWSDLYQNPADPEYHMNWVMLAIQVPYPENVIFQVWKEGWELTGKASEYKERFLNRLVDKKMENLVSKIKAEL